MIFPLAFSFCADCLGHSVPESQSGKSAKMSYEEMLERAARKKRKQTTSSSEDVVLDVPPIKTMPSPPPNIPKAPKDADYVLRVPSDFLTGTSMSASLWPTAEKLLFPSAERRLEKMTPAQIISEAVSLQLNVSLLSLYSFLSFFLSDILWFGTFSLCRTCSQLEGTSFLLRRKWLPFALQLGR